jgi:hypothetical protein
MVKGDEIMDTTVLLAFIGGLSASIITIVGNYLNKRHETKQAYRQTILDNAFREYEVRSAMLKEFQKDGVHVTYYPWDMYVLCYDKLYKLLDKKDYTREDIISTLEEMKKISEVYDEFKATIPK